MRRYEALVEMCRRLDVLTPEDPYPGRQDWCAARVEATERRLAEVTGPGQPPLVLVHHWPLVRHPTEVMTHQEFVQWCGTVRTADWHTRFDVRAVVYGHLHIPRSTVYDGVRAVRTFTHRLDITLPPQEEAVLARAVPKRRAEFPRTHTTPSPPCPQPAPPDLACLRRRWAAEGDHVVTAVVAETDYRGAGPRRAR